MWRHDGLLDRGRHRRPGPLAARRLAHRQRRQRATAAPARPTAGIVRLRLVPDGVVAHAGLQPGLWGEAGAERERAHRALVRVQGLLGPEAVVTAVLGGGRGSADRVAPGAVGRRADPAAGRGVAGADPVAPRRAAPARRGPAGCRRPRRRRCCPSRCPRAVRRRRRAGRGRARGCELTGAPASVVVGAGQAPVEVDGWAGPWPVDERWWAPAEAAGGPGSRSHLADGRALLLALRGGHWTVEAIYD